MYSAQNKTCFEIKSEFIKKKYLAHSEMTLGWYYKKIKNLFYNPNFLSKKEIEDISYEDLSDKKWLNSIAVKDNLIFIINPGNLNVRA